MNSAEPRNDLKNEEVVTGMEEPVLEGGKGPAEPDRTAPAKITCAEDLPPSSRPPMMIYEHGKEPREVKITPAAEGEQGERGKIAYYIDGIPAYEMPMPAGFRERAMEEVVSKIGQATFDQFVARQQEIVDKAATRTAAENAAATRKLMADMAALRDKLRA